MTRVAEMLEAYPKSLAGLDQAKLAECIEACFDCAQVCTACADACLAEEMVADLVDCAEICATTGTILSRRTGSDVSVTEALLETCRIACRVCGSECASHADMHDHCRICAEECRRCEETCDAVLDAIP